ncbi:MAG: relaxase domain-containing protein, partial [Verrucomicrobia bacterium]|nr:relaxase domain-containing protein [Verrucomicrobiota bacterium]
MLSISGPMRGAGSADYYLILAQDDYYVSASEFPGYWLGKGASQLGLEGQVHREVFRNLLDGTSPDGSRPLVQNAKKEDRQSGWDLTLSAPKSVSVLWALGPPEIRAEIERLHQESVRFALGYLEKRAGLTRRGKGGAIQEAAALSFAVFQHGSSRALDPQMHSHGVLLNVGVREDGSTGALVTREIFRLKMKAGYLYRERLAFKLTRTFGVTLEAQKVGFRVVGVPE